MYMKFSMIFFLLSIIFFYLFLHFLFKDLSIFFEWNIIELNSNSLIIILLFDWMSFLFLTFVFFITSMVILYSSSYLKNDLNFNRFIILVFLFIISMMFLILCPNLISILIGWDGLGLVSYCLVIYFQNYKSYNAGMLTSLSNRIGDVALLISIAWLLNMGSWSFYFYLEFFYSNNFFFIMILLAAMTKSAQIPFSSWLPAAMAAPTPVSALVHSSTLVTAGVYLLIRFYSFFFNSNLMFFMLLIGCLTMFMSGLSANFEMDFKKIIALSTLSQLGLMIGTLSLGYEKLTFFHLLTHALFKSLLFLCAGMFIHSMMNFQDVRVMGGFNLFFSMMNFNISSLALCGMPFLAGFYSKDMILEFVIMSNVNFMIFFFFSTGLTVLYSFRLIFFSMMNFSGFNIISMYEDMMMIYPMFLLMIFSIIGGSFLSWLIFPFFNLVIMNIFNKFLVLMVCLVGILISIFLNLKKLKMMLIFLNYKFMFFNFFMWFMPIIFCLFFNNFFLKISNYYKLFNDLGWFEFYGKGMLMILKMDLNFISLKNFLILFLLVVLFLFFILL